MSVLPDYVINVLSKLYDLGKKSLLLYFYDALSSCYDNLFCHELCVYVEHRHVGNRNKHIRIFYHNGHLFVYENTLNFSPLLFLSNFGTLVWMQRCNFQQNKL